MSSPARRNGRHLVYQLASARADQLGEFLRMHFHGEAAPSPEQLEAARRLLETIAEALEGADAERWQQISAAGRSLRSAEVPAAPPARGGTTRELNPLEAIAAR